MRPRGVGEVNGVLQKQKIFGPDFFSTFALVFNINLD